MNYYHRDPRNFRRDASVIFLRFVAARFSPISGVHARTHTQPSKCPLRERPLNDNGTTRIILASRLQVGILPVFIRKQQGESPGRIDAPRVLAKARCFRWSLVGREFRAENFLLLISPAPRIFIRPSSFCFAFLPLFFVCFIF